MTPSNVPSESPRNSTGREVLIVFTRHPQPGRTKTRLIPALGPEGAALLHDEMTRHTLAGLLAAVHERRLCLEVCHDGGSTGEMREWLGPEFRFYPQGGGDLGARLHRAAAAAFEAGARSVVMIGSDCPGLDSAVVRQAFEQLASYPLVLGPSVDGGYYLIGLRQAWPELFSGISWGTPAVLATTVAAARKLNLEPRLLTELADVDEPPDLLVWERVRQLSRAVSVVIPALNEARQIGATIEAVMTGRPFEVILADGGSHDGTVEVARERGARVVSAPTPRARQLNAGAAVARGGLLLFLHADTELPPGWLAALHEGLRLPGTVGGAFAFSIRESFRGRGLVEWSTNWRSRHGQMPYGDQGLFVRRWAFEHLGGFPDLPVMEDYEFVRRMRALGRIVTLPQAARTSGRRWLRWGLVRTTVIHQLMILGYHAGVRPDRLAAIYRGRTGSANAK